MRMMDWSSDVCSSDLCGILRASNDETQFRRRARRFEQQPLQCGLPVRAVCSKVAQIPTQSRAGGRITVSIDRTIEGRGYRRAIGLFDDGGNGPAREAE